MGFHEQTYIQRNTVYTIDASTPTSFLVLWMQRHYVVCLCNMNLIDHLQNRPI